MTAVSEHSCHSALAHLSHAGIEGTSVGLPKGIVGSVQQYCHVVEEVVFAGKHAACGTTALRVPLVVDKDGRFTASNRSEYLLLATWAVVEHETRLVVLLELVVFEVGRFSSLKLHRRLALWRVLIAAAELFLSLCIFAFGKRLHINGLEVSRILLLVEELRRGHFGLPAGVVAQVLGGCT